MLNHKVIQQGSDGSNGGGSLKEHYEVLGLKDGASLEEVTARYLALKKEIIASIEKGKKPGKTIPEINEAYVKLKESKIPVAVNFDLEEHLRKSFTSVRAERRRARRKKIIISASILALFLIGGISLLVMERAKEDLLPGSTSSEDSSSKTKGSLEKAGSYSPSESKAIGKMAQVATKEPSKPTLRETPKPAAPKPSLQETPAASVPKAEDLKAKEKAPLPADLKPAPPVEAAKAVPQEPSKPILPEKPKPAAQEVGMVEPSKPVSEEVGKAEPPKPTPPEPAPAPSKEPQELKAKAEAPVAVPPPPKPAPPVEVAKAAPQEEIKIVKSETATIPEPVREKEQRVASVSPSAIASDLEVRNFFDNYLVRYNQKEINGFIALFSAKAIQNQKDDVEKIRKTYENFFAQMESVNYQIAISGIEPKQDRVEVRAQYALEGIVAKGRKSQTWKGQIRWVLIKEGGALKVLSLDYQPQSSK
jgi:hypothetical protein